MASTGGAPQVVHPTYKWADNDRYVFVTVEATGLKASTTKVHMTPEGKVSLTGTRPTEPNRTFAVELDLDGRILVNDSKTSFKERAIELKIRKAEPAKWKRLQKAHIKKPPYEKVDWDRVDVDALDSSDGGAGGDGPDEDDLDSFMGKLDKKGSKAAPKKRAKPQEGGWGPDALDYLLLAVVWFHAVACPFTKVEESFNLHATHDLLFQPLSLASHDHRAFPGVVPRTFLGAAALALLASPVHLAARAFGLAPAASLYIVRLFLGAAVVASLGAIRRAVARLFGGPVGAAYAIVSAVQFHLTFYASRTLPNTFALVLTNAAVAAWIGERYDAMTAAFAVAAVVFRSEVALLALPACLYVMAQKQYHPKRFLRTGTIASLAALAASVAFDSLLWGRPLWPEGEVFYFNTILNQSHRWGRSPFLWYFSSAIPRALLGTLPLAGAGLLLEKERLSRFLLPVYAFVTAYSFLPHKELRFVMYAVPVINIAAAVAVGRAWEARSRRRVLFLAVAALLLGTALLSLAFATVSSHNYPAAHALAALHRRVPSAAYANATGAGAVPAPAVHIDAAAAMTGVSRFLERSAPWTYSKEEGLGAGDLPARFTHLVSGNASVPGYVLVHTESGFERLAARQWPPRILLAPKVYVHEREDVHKQLTEWLRLHPRPTPVPRRRPPASSPAATATPAASAAPAQEAPASATGDAAPGTEHKEEL